MKFCVSPSKELPLGVVFPACPPTLMKPLSRLSAFHICYQCSCFGRSHGHRKLLQSLFVQSIYLTFLSFQWPLGCKSSLSLFSTACASCYLPSFLKTSIYVFSQPTIPSLLPSLRQAAQQLSVPVLLFSSSCYSQSNWFGDVESIAEIPSPFLSFLPLVLDVFLFFSL